MGGNSGKREREREEALARQRAETRRQELAARRRREQKARRKREQELARLEAERRQQEERIAAQERERQRQRQRELERQRAEKRRREAELAEARRKQAEARRRREEEARQRRQRERELELLRALERQHREEQAAEQRREEERERKRMEREWARQRAEEQRRREELAAQRRRQEQLERERVRRAREVEEKQRKLRQEKERRDRERREHERRQAEARRKAIQEEEARKAKKERERRAALTRQRSELNVQLAEVEKRLQRTTSYVSKTKRDRDTLETELNKEKQQIAKFMHEQGDRNVIRIVLLGETGDGKSTMANRLFGDKSKDANKGPFVVSKSINSCTQKIQKETSRYVLANGTRHTLSIVDTPGSGDSGGRDRFHAASLVEFLRGCNGIHQFVLVRNFTNPRLNASHHEMLTKMADMFGRGFWAHFCVVLTRVESSRNYREFPSVTAELRNRIRNHFKLTSSEAPLAMFGIGLDDYRENLDLLVSHSAGQFYRCEQLKSPHDEMQARVNQLRRNVHQLEQEVTNLTNQRNEIVINLGSNKIIQVNKKRRVPDSGFGVGSAKKKRRIG